MEKTFKTLLKGRKGWQNKRKIQDVHGQKESKYNDIYFVEIHI